MSREQMRILGIPVDRLDMEGALARFESFLNGEDCRIIVTPNSEIVLNATKDPGLAEIIERADMVIPDGIGLVHASKIIGKPLKERVTGVDFSYAALGLLAERGGSAYFLGAKPGIAEKAAEKLCGQLPGLVCAGCRDGYFKPEQEEEIAEEIRSSGADFLLVALGSPKQERFMYAHRESLGVKAAIGVGGCFDVWSGTLERAPEFYRDHGLEWLFRLKQEPKRIGRTAALPLFLIKVLLHGRKDGDK
jgi:N-acetylglucosaminyldiphosphoundecaprenol N-acetyl-beta-D-mannosaminyltransferase